MEKGKLAQNIDEYIAGFPKETQLLLEAVRTAIKAAAPKAEEAIKYAMPAFTLNGNLVYFAGYKNHIGFYPEPRAIETFKEELATYKVSKGAIQFPIATPLPLGLIKKIVKFRVKENQERAVKKATK
jgi:uncharacterized protein YdhG (YjbR/CyaY superfamily)